MTVWVVSAERTSSYNDVVSAEAGVRRNLSQQQTFRQKKNSSFVWLVFLEPDLIADFFAELVECLEGDTIG